MMDLEVQPKNIPKGCVSRMSDKSISLVQECTNKYYIKNLNENENEICIKIPKRFKTLWLIKLSELKATEEELELYKDDNIE